MKLSNLSARFWVAVALIVGTLLLGLIGPLIVGTDPNEVIGGLYDPPQASPIAMWLGTDNEGQSVLANLVYGIRTSLWVGFVAGIVATIVGVIIGLIGGYVGGLIDDLLSALTNIALAIPTLIVIILVSVALQSRSPTILALVIGFTAWPWLARAVRAQSSSVRTREHIDVARLSGARSASILAWDVLPYLLSYVVMAFVLQVSAAILFEATLSLLGLGPSGTTSLGIMLYWAIAWGSIRTGAWWAFMPPTIMLTHHLVLAAAVAVQPGRGVQPAVAARQGGEAQGSRPAADRLAARPHRARKRGRVRHSRLPRRSAPPVPAGGPR